MMGVLPFTHSIISLFHKKIVQVVFVCMSALMIGVLPFTHSTISLSLVHKKFPDGVYLYVCPDDGGVTIHQFHFHFFWILLSLFHNKFLGGFCVHVCSNDGGVAGEKQRSLLAALQSAGPVFQIQTRQSKLCGFYDEDLMVNCKNETCEGV